MVDTVLASCELKRRGKTKCWEYKNGINVRIIWRILPKRLLINRMDAIGMFYQAFHERFSIQNTVKSFIWQIKLNLFASPTPNKIFIYLYIYEVLVFILNVFTKVEINSRQKSQIPTLMNTFKNNYPQQLMSAKLIFFLQYIHESQIICCVYIIYIYRYYVICE